MVYERIPKEVRVRLPEDIHVWLKEAAKENDQFITEFIRDCIKEKKDRSERQGMIRNTDPLIYEMAEKINAMFEKMGIEIPEKEPENSYQLEGENSVGKEGVEVPPKCGT